MGTVRNNQKNFKDDAFQKKAQDKTLGDTVAIASDGFQDPSVLRSTFCPTARGI